MHLLRVNSFQILDMHLHRSSKSTIFFVRWCTIVVLFLWFFWAIIHYGRFITSSSSLFQLDSFVRQIFCLLPIKILSNRYKRYFHSHIPVEDPVHCKWIVTTNLLFTPAINIITPDKRGAGATEGKGGCIAQHNIQHNTSKLFPPLRVYVCV